jgi:hypothetical protein
MREKPKTNERRHSHMQIKGQFTRIRDLSDRRRMPRLGKIRLGVKVINALKKTDYPKETDYFVVPSEVEKVYGKCPRELDVMFPVNDIDRVFPQAYKWYGESRGLKCIGNGEVAMHLNEKNQTMEERECPCPLLESGCSRRAHLLVILPLVNMGGVYQIDTISYHSIVDINSGIDFVGALLGRFAMVPLKLKRVPRETFGNGQRQTHYTLQLTADMDVHALNHLRENTTKVLLSTRNIMLDSPEDINPVLDPEAVIVLEENGTSENGTKYAGLEQKEDRESGAEKPLDRPISVDSPKPSDSQVSSESLTQNVKPPDPQPSSAGKSKPPSPAGPGETPSPKPGAGNGNDNKNGKNEWPNPAQIMAIRKLAEKKKISPITTDLVVSELDRETAGNLIRAMQSGDYSFFLKYADQEDPHETDPMTAA